MLVAIGKVLYCRELPQQFHVHKLVFVMNQVKNFEQKALRIFQKNGGDGEGVKIFDHFSLQTKEKILNEFKLKTDEKPIVAGSNTEKPWFLLTNKRLLRIVADAVEDICLSDIEKINIPTDKLNPNDKKDWKTLEIVDFGNKSTFFEVEKGLPFFGIWNVLLFVTARNERYKN